MRESDKNHATDQSDPNRTSAPWSARYTYGNRWDNRIGDGRLGQLNNPFSRKIVVR